MKRYRRVILTLAYLFFFASTAYANNCATDTTGLITSAKPCKCGTTSECNLNYCWNGRICQSSQGSVSEMNLTIVLLKNIQTCVVGDTYVSGNSCNIDYGNGTTFKKFVDNSNFMGLEPSNPMVNSYAQKVCMNTSLTTAEITSIKNGISTFISKVNANSSGSLILNPIYIEYSGETKLSKWGCGLHPFPWDVSPLLGSQINEDTDFIIVVNDIYDDSQNLRFNVGGCGGTYGADWGIKGAGYATVPKTTSLWFECAIITHFSTNGLIN